MKETYLNLQRLLGRLQKTRAAYENQLEPKELDGFKKHYSKHIGRRADACHFLDPDVLFQAIGVKAPEGDKGWHRSNLSAIWHLWQGARDARRIIAQREPYRPIAKRVNDMAKRADECARRVLGPGKRIVPEPDPLAAFPISKLWDREVEAVGGPSIGYRFIASAKLIDQIGEYDLFEIQYYEGGIKAIERQKGYVGRYRGTSIRGFGVKPETALSWTQRQAVMHAAKTLKR